MEIALILGTLGLSKETLGILSKAYSLEGVLGREGKVGQEVLRVPSLDSLSLSPSVLRGGEGAENLRKTEKQTAFGLSKPNLPGALLPEFHLTARTQQNSSAGSLSGQESVPRPNPHQPHCQPVQPGSHVDT